MSNNCLKKIGKWKNLQNLDISFSMMYNGSGASIVASMKNLRHIKLGCLKFTDQNLIELTNNCNGLESLQFFWTDALSDLSMIPLLEKRKNTLKGLHIRNYLREYSYFEVEHNWFNHLSQCQKIEELSIWFSDDNAGLDNVMSTKQMKAISKLQNLKILDLVDVFEVRDDILSLFADIDDKLYPAIFSNRKLKNLVKLRLNSCDGVEEVIDKILIECPKLEILEFTEIGHIGIRNLKHCQNLKKMTLHCHTFSYDEPPITPTDLVSFFGSTALNNLLDLTILVKNAMNDEVIDSIAASCPQLEELCLLINDETVRARSISKLQNLKRLKLTYWDDQSDEEIKNELMDDYHEMGDSDVLIDILPEDLIYIFSNKNLSKLLYLSLFDCDNINDEVLKTIALNCSQLKNVRLFKSKNISEATFDFLRENCPNISKLEFYIPNEY